MKRHLTLSVLIITLFAISCTRQNASRDTEPPPKIPKTNSGPQSGEGSQKAPVKNPPKVVKTPQATAADLKALKQKHAKRFCRRDEECVYVPIHPCTCPPCKRGKLKRSVNKETAKRRLHRYARARYKCKPCRSCKGWWAQNTTPACVKHLCTTVTTGKSKVTPAP